MMTTGTLVSEPDLRTRTEHAGVSVSSRNSIPKLRLQPRRALEALKRLSENPDDTSEVFTIIEALSGQAPVRVMTRFRKEADGIQLLAERPRVLSLLANRPALEAMPQGSLAEAYLKFLDSEGITAEGLVQASLDGRKGTLDPDSDLAYITERIRDTHDLWHTVTGYQGDVVGEAALLAFNVAQLRNPGVAAIVTVAMLQFRDAEFTSLMYRAFKDGTRAAWLPSVRWEALLPLPLHQVRTTLRIPPVPKYVPLRTRELREFRAQEQLARAAS